jgi:hypothetical protein
VDYARPGVGVLSGGVGGSSNRLFHFFTFSLFHIFTFSPFHPFTFSPACTVEIILQRPRPTSQEMLSTAVTNPSSNATPTPWPLRMQETRVTTNNASPNCVKHVSIRDVSGVLRKKAVDALVGKFAIELKEARQEEDSESDADITASLKVWITHHDVKYCFDTDGLILDGRYDKDGRLDRVAVHRESSVGDWFLLEVVQVSTLATSAEPAAKKRRLVTIDIGKGGKTMYEVFG